MESIERTFGPYRLLEELGRGAMGVVYRAEHQTTKQLVALKTLHAPRPSLSDALQREIYALSKLSHPGVVSIQEFGVSDGQPWYAMPLLAGKTLRDALGAPKTEAEILPLLRSLCETLAFLHGNGVIHRDLKPENIILVDGARPVFVDFGLSVTQRELSRDAIEDSSEISGTVEYMSPEQIMGEVVDARADLYSLGCILYEMLTGNPPFQAKISAKILRAHLQTSPAPLPPSLQISSGLEGLTRKLLEKSPRARVGHASSILAMLGMESSGAKPYLYRPGLVGREEALTALSSALQSLEEGAGSISLVGGVSGVGKTRLLQEVARLAVRKQLRVLTGQCLPRSDIETPLSPLQRLLRSIADENKEAPQLLGSDASVLAPYEPSIIASQVALALPPDAARLRLFRALADALERFVARRSLVLLLDDLQWADELTVGFLSYWTKQSAKVLVVAAYRSEEGQSLEKSLAGAPRISLGRLGEEAVNAMVSDMLASSQPKGFSQFLLRSSEGNPFFVAEYLRASLRQGLLAQDSAGHWIISAGAEGYEALPLPKTLRELVERRLSGLTNKANRLVEAAATLGRPGEQSLFSLISGVTAEEARETIQELFGQQVFEESEDGLRFTHDKLREVAYESMPRERATTLHKTAALVLEQKKAAPAELGYHFERGAMTPEARRYYLIAARAAVTDYAHQEAERLYLSYLRLSERSIEAITARNELAKSVLFDTGRYKDALEQSAITKEESRSLSAKREEGNSLFVEGVSRWSLGKIDDAKALLREALQIYQALGEEREEGATLHSLGVIERTQGQLDASYELCTRALALHRKVNNRAGEGMSMGILAGIEWQRGELESAARSFEEVLALHRENKNRLSEGIIVGNLAGVFWQKRELEKAAELYQQGLKIHREVGNRRSLGITLSNLAVIQQDMGLMEEAAQRLQESISTLRDLGDKLYLAHALLFRAALLRRAGGSLEEAALILSEAEEIFIALKTNAPLLRCFCERGHLALARGQSPDAFLQRARELGATPKSEEERALLSLESAAKSDKLLRGERPEDLPEGLRERLMASGL